ncbi:ATP-binding protein [Sphingomonas sp.]|uniref:ATP-binding protein n=1 Tax=Sphingomonas sp. TaxID=28214 RepID=UPI002DD6A769|nr:ATP-binding protein [Sphingomonas sp.]
MPLGTHSNRPFVHTTIARQLLSRLRLTHEERGISVIAGPWGIGKSTAIAEFVREQELGVAVVKVDPEGRKGGASPQAVMRLVLEAVAPMIGRTGWRITSTTHWALRLNFRNLMEDWADDNYGRDWQIEAADRPRFTIVLDEAQYLSREAIEMLRYWNDSDGSSVHFPIGLVFVGNNEFVLQESGGDDSVLSGAVRSRAMFIESLEYTDVSDLDLTLFAQSRGIDDAGAIQAIIAYFSTPRIRRDLRNAERFIGVFKRRAGSAPVTADIVRTVLAA